MYKRNNRVMDLQEELTQLGHDVQNIKQEGTKCYWCRKCNFVYYIPFAYNTTYYLTREFNSTTEARRIIEVDCGDYRPSNNETCDEMIIRGIIHG